SGPFRNCCPICGPPGLTPLAERQYVSLGLTLHVAAASTQTRGPSPSSGRVASPCLSTYLLRTGSLSGFVEPFLFDKRITKSYDFVLPARRRGNSALDFIR